MEIKWNGNAITIDTPNQRFFFNIVGGENLVLSEIASRQPGIDGAERLAPSDVFERANDNLAERMTDYPV